MATDQPTAPHAEARPAPLLCTSCAGHGSAPVCNARVRVGAHDPQPDSAEGQHAIEPWLRRVFGLRIVRYGLVGGLGIPVNNLALALAEPVLGGAYWLAAPCAFEIGTLVNFMLNQCYTYSDQTHLRGWDWPKRALKAQLSSGSAWVLALLIGYGLKYGLHINDFVATDVSFACTFGYTFVLANRLVFTPAPQIPHA